MVAQAHVRLGAGLVPCGELSVSHTPSPRQRADLELGCSVEDLINRAAPCGSQLRVAASRRMDLVQEIAGGTRGVLIAEHERNRPRIHQVQFAARVCCLVRGHEPRQ